MLRPLLFGFVVTQRFAEEANNEGILHSFECTTDQFDLSKKAKNAAKTLIFAGAFAGSSLLVGAETSACFY